MNNSALAISSPSSTVLIRLDRRRDTLGKDKSAPAANGTNRRYPMSASDGNGTSRPSIDSYQVHTAWPSPHDRHARPSMRHALADPPTSRALRRSACAPAVSATSISPKFDTVWVYPALGRSASTALHARHTITVVAAIPEPGTQP